MQTHLTDDPRAVIDGVISAARSTPNMPGSIDPYRDDIKRSFHNKDSLQSIIKSLSRENTSFATQTLEILQNKSPISLAITFEQLSRGRSLNFEETMKMEYRIVCRMVRGHDFFEGVRALIIDKDQNPKWSPASIEDITPETIRDYFSPLLDGELALL